MTDVFSIEVYANDKQLNASQIAKEQNKYIISGAPYGAMLTITLTNKFTNSIFSIYRHTGQNKAFGYDYVGVKNQFVFDAFEVTGGKTIYAFVAVMPISLNINGGTGDIPRYTTAISGGIYTFNISSAESLTNGNAEFYYFSDDKDKLDFTDTRYDTSNTYSRSIDEIKSSSATRLKLYARYAEYSTSNWTMDNSGCVLYTGTGATGKFLNSNSSNNSKNFVVVPKEINHSIVKGLQSNAFSELGDTVKYILLPGGEFVTIGATMLGTVNSVTKIQLPSGISSIAVATFRNASNLIDITLNESLESSYSAPNGVLYNKSKTILYAHPQQKELLSYNIFESISTIEAYACFNCINGAASIVLPNIVEIKEYAFSFALGLLKINLGSSLKAIETYAFSNCSNLQEVLNANYIEQYTFNNCSQLSHITFAEDCSLIPTYSFKNCISLPYIKIISSVSLLIQEYAFANTSMLTEVEFIAKTLQLEQNCFNEAKGKTNNIRILTLIATDKVALNLSTGFLVEQGYGKSALNGCSNLFRLHVENLTTTQIYFSDFNPVEKWNFWTEGYFKGTHSVVNTIVEFGLVNYAGTADGYYTSDDLFFDWILEDVNYNLTDMTAEIKEGKHRIIGYRGAQTDLIIPYSLQYMGEHYVCGDQVVRLTNDGTVSGDVNLNSVDFSNTKTIGDNNATSSVFGDKEGKSKLKNVIFGLNTVVNKYAFYDCIGLDLRYGVSYYSGPDPKMKNIIYFGDYAFAYCRNIRTFEIGVDSSSKITFGNNVFYRCIALDRLVFNTIPTSVTVSSFTGIAVGNCVYNTNDVDFANFKKVMDKTGFPQGQRYGWYFGVYYQNQWHRLYTLLAKASFKDVVVSDPNQFMWGLDIGRENLNWIEVIGVNPQSCAIYWSETQDRQHNTKKTGVGLNRSRVKIWQAHIRVGVSVSVTYTNYCSLIPTHCMINGSGYNENDLGTTNDSKNHTFKMTSDTTLTAYIG